MRKGNSDPWAWTALCNCHPQGTPQVYQGGGSVCCQSGCGAFSGDPGEHQSSASGTGRGRYPPLCDLTEA